MARPKKLLVDCSTGVTTEVELTDEEIAERETEIQVNEAKETERLAAEKLKTEAKASALAKLQTLGLTENEAVALLG